MCDFKVNMNGILFRTIVDEYELLLLSKATLEHGSFIKIPKTNIVTELRAFCPDKMYMILPGYLNLWPHEYVGRALYHSATQPWYAQYIKYQYLRFRILQDVYTCVYEKDLLNR